MRAVLGACELGECRGDVVGNGLVVLAAEVGQQLLVAREVLRTWSGEPVGGRDVEAEQFAVRALRHARRPADQRFGARCAGDRDEHALACLPRLGDAVPLAVVLERLVDAVGNPQERELAQRREVAGAEVVRERGVDLLRLVDVAVRHAAAERFGRHVDELELIGLAHDRVGDRLALRDTGDAFDDVVHRFEVLDVQGGDHVDARVQELFDVLPPLLVARSRDVRVGELVDEHLRGMAGQDRVDVHLLERAPPILEASARHHLEVGDLLRGLRAAMGLDEPDHHVGAAVVAAPALVQHGERLADARCGAEIYAQRAPGHGPVSRADGRPEEKRPVRKPLRRTGNALSPR